MLLVVIVLNFTLEKNQCESFLNNDRISFIIDNNYVLK